MNAPLASSLFTAACVPPPRFREAGDLTLDRGHHDGRVEDRWLHLHPCEFLLLWLLAEHPGEPVAEDRLAADLRRLGFACRAGGIARHVAGARKRLAAVGLDGLLAGESGRGFYLDLRSPAAPLPGQGLRSH